MAFWCHILNLVVSDIVFTSKPCICSDKCYEVTISTLFIDGKSDGTNSMNSESFKSARYAPIPQLTKVIKVVMNVKKIIRCIAAVHM